MVFESTTGGRPRDRTPAPGSRHEWLGLDRTFHAHAAEAAATASGKQFQKELARDMARIRGKLSPLGVPLSVDRTHGAKLRHFAGAYHRSVETVVRAWAEHEEVRRAVTVPPALHELVRSDRISASGRIHLCRIDLLPQPDGGFEVMETNANCPGGLLSTGWASRKWRLFLSDAGIQVPAALEHESRRWMASWFIRTAEAETGLAPDFVVLLRWEGGNRLGLPGLAEELSDSGVDVVEADPRELARAADGTLTLGGRTVRHAYWKLGIQQLCRHRHQAQPVLEAMLRRDLFVQNGVAGRFIGDNKLCLAVLSDPAFDPLFDPEDLELVRPHLPWSRNLALCEADRLREIRSNPADYVLKRPLDTRGYGVVMGPESTDLTDWRNAVDLAVQEGWLVQRFCSPTRLAVPSETPYHHDLSLGMADGRLVAGQVRSSSELRINVALTGRLHPVYIDA